MRFLSQCSLVLIGLAFSLSSPGAPTPKAGKCLTDVATVSEELDIPARQLRLARPFQKLVTVLNSSFDPQVIMQNLISENLRQQVFVLEGDGRLYEDSGFFEGKDKKILKKFNDRVTALENMMGNYTDSVNYLTDAKAVKAPKKLIDWLTQYNEDLRVQFIDLLEKDGWLPSNPEYLGLYAEVSKVLSQVKGRENDNFLLGAMADYLEKDSKTVFDPHSPEDRHRLRRHLRWFMLKAQSTNGLVQILENDGGKIWTHPKLEEERVAKYSQITVIGKQKHAAWV